MNLLVFFLVVSSVLMSIEAGSITRNKRGFLSRTGLCPDPAGNFQKKDVRLNYWGIAVIRKGDLEDAPCAESECNEDSHCDGNRKCCKNNCGGSVCSVSMRDPDPCSSFQCPNGQTCKIQKVKCVMPECPEATAVNRPTCIPKEMLDETNTATLGDFQPDTTEALQQYNAMQHDEANKDNNYADATSYTAPAADGNAAYQSPEVNAMPAPMVENAAEAPNFDALSFSDQQQSFTAPSDQSLSVPSDTANIVQTPMDTTNYAPVPSSDMASFQAPPQASSPIADQPSPDVVAQTPVQSGPLV